MSQIPRHRLENHRPRLDGARLVELTRRYADDVVAGRYPQLRFDSERRWHERIYQDEVVDVWLITWMPTQGAELHDHGGSSGAFSVLSGELSEAVYTPAKPRGVAERVHAAGDSVGFGAYYVHDVRNLGDAPAVSVHAYSPPLDLMNYYDLAGGNLEMIASIVTDDPETVPGSSDQGVETGIAS